MDSALRARSWGLREKISRRFVERKEGQQSYEGSGIGKEDLREVQGDYSRRCGTCDLREPQAQAAPGISKTWQEGKLPRRQGMGMSEQGVAGNNPDDSPELSTPNRQSLLPALRGELA
jgi:hypothetical protein